jgi:hypothetical protein
MKLGARQAQERVQRNEARRLRWRTECERATERRREARELARYLAEVADTPLFLPRPARGRPTAGAQLAWYDG